MSAAPQRDLLVEIGTEELPPKALLPLQQAFVAALRTGLERTGLKHGKVAGFATPRRLAVCVQHLAAEQPTQHVRRRGPPLASAFDASGAPTRAALAFATSCGTRVEALQRLDEGKGSFLYFTGTKAGEAAVRLLPGLVQEALDALPIPRRMHWGAGDALFVRPVHWVVMLYGRDVVPATLLETRAGRHTRGHRFLSPKPLALASPAGYERTLRERGYVLADFDARRARIRAAVTAAAAAVHGRALLREALLEEVTALTEWPVALAGFIEERFLSLPREVLISTLEDHERCFPVEGVNGGLLPGFIAVSNIKSREPQRVRAGYERVVRARLADAAFFWEQDRREPLAARMPALEAVTYQARLGSLGDKTRRVRALAGQIAEAWGDGRAEAQRAAELCKCDLLTQMVGEFPELQGIMGSYYALADGESHEVATSLREQYLPRSAGDGLPTTRTGVTLAIADKLDTLAGAFAIDAKPTGTKDPFGLRRAALGVQRILIEKSLDLDLKRFSARAVMLVRADIAKVAAAEPRAAPAAPTDGAKAARTPASATDAVVAEAIYDFLMERLRAYYLEGAAASGRAPITPEMFEAVLAARPASPLDFDARLQALSRFLELPEAASLTVANKRIANILRKAPDAPVPAASMPRLREPAELRLSEALAGLRDSVQAATRQHRYADALAQLAQLRPAVDVFFDEVMVMDEDPQVRASRLSLLAQLHALFAGVADLSRLPG